MFNLFQQLASNMEHKVVKSAPKLFQPQKILRSVRRILGESHFSDGCESSSNLFTKFKKYLFVIDKFKV